MPCRDDLHRWLVVRWLPKMQRIVVAACYQRSDAGHLQAVRRLIPDGKFDIVFEPRRYSSGAMQSANR